MCQHLSSAIRHWHTWKVPLSPVWGCSLTGSRELFPHFAKKTPLPAARGLSLSVDVSPGSSWLQSSSGNSSYFVVYLNIYKCISDKILGLYNTQSICNLCSTYSYNISINIAQLLWYVLTANKYCHTVTLSAKMSQPNILLFHSFLQRTVQTTATCRDPCSWMLYLHSKSDSLLFSFSWSLWMSTTSKSIRGYQIAKCHLPVILSLKGFFWKECIF